MAHGQISKFYLRLSFLGPVSGHIELRQEAVTLFGHIGAREGMLGQQPAPEIAIRGLLAVELHIDMALLEGRQLLAAQLDGAGNTALVLAAKLQVENGISRNSDSVPAVNLHAARRR